MAPRLLRVRPATCAVVKAPTWSVPKLPISPAAPSALICDVVNATACAALIGNSATTSVDEAGTSAITCAAVSAAIWAVKSDKTCWELRAAIFVALIATTWRVLSAMSCSSRKATDSALVSAPMPAVVIAATCGPPNADRSAVSRPATWLVVNAAI